MKFINFITCKNCNRSSADLRAQNTQPTINPVAVDVRVEMKDTTTPTPSTPSTTPSTTANLDVAWACSQNDLK